MLPLDACLEYGMTVRNIGHEDSQDLRLPQQFIDGFKPGYLWSVSASGMYCRHRPR